MSYRRFSLIRLGQALVALWLVATLVFLMFFVLLTKPERNLFAGGPTRSECAFRSTSSALTSAHRPPEEVQAQMDAARRAHTNGFLLWNPQGVYTEQVLKYAPGANQSGGQQ